ncbi:MalY/PatB family protein [Levilactobacillus bambusae]|uniref:cysteine-S-conjugate beta-lyase n=1 Tax=Levilactobacillus bambusae TaxID=2024736 RepID=A0A2V1MXA1_9LACO|nr:MalY/PatB family protein [Levilactobacillus bambusae]PWF99693.1 plastocyanin [Levilactobacillus bambusae]
MTTYNFDDMIDRRQSYSEKWAVKETELPMWIADMDFKTAPAIIDAFEKKAASGIFGYEFIPDAYYSAVQHWMATRHQYHVDRDWLLFTTGVIPAVSSMVRRMSRIGENVLVQAPVYNIFYNSIVNNGRHVVSSDLVYDGQRYHIDWDDLEAKMADPETTLMIVCNPHNPIGHVWSRETLAHIGELANKHHLLVISDEIHGDLTAKDAPYVPFAAASETCANLSMTCVSPSKTFNVAAMHAATLIIPNEGLRQRVNRGINTDEIAEPNALAIEGTIAAYTQSSEWLDALLTYLHGNKRLLNQFISENLSELTVVPSDATYLVWIDCSNITNNAEELCHFLREETGLYLSAGNIYGGDGYDFIRMNIACPRERLTDGLHRLEAGISSYAARNSQI